MALTPNDLGEIEKLIIKHLDLIQKDISSIKDDVNLLARLNQLDDIRKEPRLRKLYSGGDQHEASI